MTVEDAAERFVEHDHDCPGRYRLRTTIRRHLPWSLTRLGVARKGREDRGCHELSAQADDDVRCYHCQVGHRTTAPWAARPGL